MRNSSLRAPRSLAVILRCPRQIVHALILERYCAMVAELRQSDYPGRWWTMLPDGRVECRLCPRFCKLNDGQRGFCFVRQRVSDRIVLATYGRSSGFCVDPIEKKPLNHFLPGTSVLSFGTAGCNLGCRFCQNWELLPKLGHLQSTRMGQARRCRVAGADRARSETTRLSLGRVYLQ